MHPLGVSKDKKVNVGNVDLFLHIFSKVFHYQFFFIMLSYPALHYTLSLKDLVDNI